MPSSADNLIREAIQAHRSGNNSEARNLLLQAVEADESSEQAWLWLSAVVDTPEDQQTCLENVLTINPNNEKAQQGLRILREKMNAAPPPAPPKPSTSPLTSLPDLPDDDDPFANVSFTPSPDENPVFVTPSKGSSAPKSSSTDDDEEDELPDVAAWGILETSSASAQRPRDEPTPSDYNDWIDNLNIGAGDAKSAFGVEPAPASSPFIGGANIMDEDTPFELDADVFNFKQDTFTKPPAGLPEAVDDENPFGTDFAFDDDLDDEPVRPPARPARSPAAAASPVSSPPAKDRLLDDIAVDDDGFDDNLFIEDDDDDDFDAGGLDPQEYFRMIPSEIKLTRMPGTRERYPAPLIIVLLLLFIFNIGAVALVFMTLSGGLA